MAMDREHIRTIVGIIGNVISFLLFASPMPTFWRIWKKKTIEEFQPYPYLASVMNCVMWIFYGLPIVHPDSTLVITINSVGLFLQICYLTIYFIYGPQKRWTVVGILAIIVVAMGAIATGTLVGLHTTTSRSRVVGIICVVFGIIMYSSPLGVLMNVIKTRSVEFMPFWLSVANFSNGLIWTAYALLKWDLYICIGNSAGAIFGFFQLLLYFAYFRTKESKMAAQKKLPTSTSDSK